jgi:hypothetical protein
VTGALTGDAVQVLLAAVDRGVALLDLSQVDDVDEAAVRAEPRISRRVSIRMAAVLASAVLLAAFPPEAPPATTTSSVRAAGQTSAVAVRRLSTRPQAYYGRCVTLRGVVGSVYGRQLFSFDDGGDGPGVLVLLPGEPEGSVAEGLELIVTGTAMAFVDADAYREQGFFDATPELVAALSRAPVVVARTASRADGTTLLRSNGSTGSEATRGSAGSDVVRGATAWAVTGGATSAGVTSGATLTDVTRAATGTDVTRGASGTDATSGPTTSSLGMPWPPRELWSSADRIAGSPESYVGQRVVLTADVALVESEGLFTLETGVEAASAVVLVLNPQPWSPPAVGARVRVSGTVQVFARQDLGRIYRLPADTQALDRYAGRPVVVADSIRTSDGRELVAASSRR